MADQWKFNEAALFEKHSLWQVFRWQHGPHRQGVGGLLAALIEPLFRWNSRYEAFLAVVIVVIAALLALYLKMRLHGILRVEDIVIPLFFLTPVQYESLVAGTNLSHGPLPLLLVIGYCLCWTINSLPWRYVGIVGANFLLIYTGFGLLMGFITPILLAIDWHRNSENSAWRGLAFVGSLISLVSFFIGYHFQPAAECFSAKPTNPIYYALFASFMYAAFVGVRASHALVPAILLGSAFLLALISALGLSFRKALSVASADQLVRVALLSYGVLFSLATAYGRFCLGLGAAMGSRYMSYIVLGFFGLYLAVVSCQEKVLHAVSLSVVVALALLTGARVNHHDRLALETLHSGRAAWRACYISYNDLQQCKSRTNFEVYAPGADQELSSKLDFLRHNRLNLYADAGAKP